MQDLLQIQLVCTHPIGLSNHDVVIQIGASAIDDQLDDLATASDLMVSTYLAIPEVDVNGCQGCGNVTIRDSSGKLLFLSYRRRIYYQLTSGESIDVGGPPWLDPESQEYDEWNAPFPQMAILHNDCEPVDPFHPGASYEVPLALAFETDNGPAEVYNRNVAHGLAVRGNSFDIIVSRAFLRKRLNCGDCPDVEIGFLILGSSR